VGSSKSTIARLLKKGIEATRAPTTGALYTFDWVNLAGASACTSAERQTFPSPMHEEPLRLIPRSGARGDRELGLG
jgi:serine protein kinase